VRNLRENHIVKCLEPLANAVRQHPHSVTKEIRQAKHALGLRTLKSSLVDYGGFSSIAIGVFIASDFKELGPCIYIR
jgi:hypothetical protein